MQCSLVTQRLLFPLMDGEMNSTMTMEVRVRGTVQGVGFRPAVWRLAHDLALVGDVRNDAEGVLIRIFGKEADVTNFIRRLPSQAPPLAHIDAIETQVIEGDLRVDGFSIAASGPEGSDTEVSADAATCPDCQAEMLDPAERRYLYPFTNCTHCGPRLSIVKGIPYDRPNTCMAEFPMCPQCRSEYENPADRRFHAQPIACHACGPAIFTAWPDSEAMPGQVNGNRRHTTTCLAQVNDCLAAGKIVALKGIGGFHLACDATNEDAVQRLRQRKNRYAKPLALMVHEVESVSRYCHLSPKEKELLLSPAAPIVLLQQKQSGLREEGEGGVLSSQIAPGTSILGFMLPYSPLHWLVCRQFGKPLVMTSGNLSEEPQIIDNREAREKLPDIADLILYHDRDIVNRIDDSVLRFMAGRPRVLRRARGYAPRSIKLPEGFEKSPQILAYGGELKSTFCLLKNAQAIVSQHQGDLEDLSTFDDYRKNLGLYAQLFRHQPEVLVADMHPEYLSTKLAREEKQKARDLPLIEVQHHHAHIAACLGENMIPLQHGKVLGIAMDGLGYGADGSLWGGEFLLADYYDFQRLACLKPLPLIGGAQAMREPWRNAYAQILNAMSWQEYSERYGDSDLWRFLNSRPLSLIDRMLEQRLNVPVASSCGRLFDAVAAALGLSRERVSFEGQGAMALEMLVPDSFTDKMSEFGAYPFQLEENPGLKANPGHEASYVVNPTSLWPQLFDDQAGGIPDSVIAARFHAGLIDALMQTVAVLSTQYDFDDVVLSGGCFQNRHLLEGMSRRLDDAGYQCLSHSRMPSNDGGISLGQALVAAARSMRDAGPLRNAENLNRDAEII